MASITGGGGITAALQAIANRLAKAKELRVGFLEGATYPDGTPVAMVAAIQNFGAPAAGIPPRPFFSNMIADKSGAWGEQFGTVMKAAGYDAAHALALMGEGIVGQLIKSVDATNAPPLSPQTIAAKGFSKPLIDTGLMRKSINKEVS